jgi:2-oxoglutarate dehydrogenase E2 component (dihydrolipoamide succinyltransferase)
MKPTMVEVKVPSVGESVREGVLAKWLIAEGAHVTKGDPLFELETDKATTEVPAPESGVVTHKAVEGEEVQIGALVALIAPGAAPASPGTKAIADNPPIPEPDPIPWDPVKDDPREPQPPGEEPKPTRVVATSVARKVAEERGVDLSRVQGSGPHGRITRGDVESATASTPSPAKAPAPPPAPAPAASVGEGQRRERMPLIRKRIAARLVEAQHTAAMLTTFNDVDMSAIMELRREHKDAFKERHGVGLGFMSFFVAAACDALGKFPRVNAFIDGEDIVYNDHAHVGVAVSTERGLVVPVVRAADTMSLAQIEKAILGFAVRARDGKIGVDDMQGGTFTVSNGGVFGSMLSTPILNPPQSAILGMHRIEDRPVARNGQVVIRPMMYLALSYDHRIVDGKEAVSFLVRIKECVENPARLLLGV